MSRKTKPSVKNSLNPIWQETFVFQVFIENYLIIIYKNKKESCVGFDYSFKNIMFLPNVLSFFNRKIE